MYTIYAYSDISILIYIWISAITSHIHRYFIVYGVQSEGGTFRLSNFNFVPTLIVKFYWNCI